VLGRAGDLPQLGFGAKGAVRRPEAPNVNLDIWGFGYPTRSTMRSTFTLSLLGLFGLSSACAGQVQESRQPVTPDRATHAPKEGAAAPPSEPELATSAAAPAAPPDIKAADPPPKAGAASDTKPDEAPPIPARTIVLHVGDSFLMAGFAQTLRPKMKELGAHYEVRSEQSSYTTTWPLRLGKLVGDYHPDLVIINLGANEVQLMELEGRAQAVERMIKTIGNRPCVWVTPPLWRKDTGIISVIREHSSPCRFFDSDVLVGRPITRQHDAIHPDAAGGEAWAEAFWRWLLAERAPAPKPGEKLPGGSGRHPVNPWRLKSAPPEEHMRTQGKTATNP
jgi:hypothetical protein